MPLTDHLEPIERRLPTMQIIAGAMLAGVVLAAGLLGVLAQGRAQAPANGQLPIVTLVALALLIIQGPLAFILPTVLAGGGLRRLAAGQRDQQAEADVAGVLLAQYQTGMILRAALLEGFGLLGAIAYFLEGQPAALLAPLICVVAMTVTFPTRERVRVWLERQYDALAEAQAGTSGPPA
jgi:hypothetical protein